MSLYKKAAVGYNDVEVAKAVVVQFSKILLNHLILLYNNLYGIAVDAVKLLEKYTESNEA
ncbi:MAG: hypothetical protein WA421_15015 [Nitrososphaeraceae archaeon]